MIVHVEFFALAREIAGSAESAIDLPDNATVGELKVRLCQLYPALARLLEHSALAINQELANENTSIPPHAEVALLPPVSGG